MSLAVFIPLSGWIADRLGARVVFCAAIAIFATGSALCGLSTSLPMMLAMRVVQGFGGAMMTPVGRLILLRSFPRSGLVSAMNWMTIPAMIGPTVGPIVGGFLTTYFSWRAIFYLNVPIGIAGFVLTLCLIENYRAPAPTRFDLRGFVLAGIGLCLSRIRDRKSRAPDHPRRPRPAVLSGRLRHPAWSTSGMRGGSEDPILDLRLLRIRTFRIGTVTGSLCRMGLDATPFLLAAVLSGRLRAEPAAFGPLDLLVEPRRDAGAHRLRLRFCGFSDFADCLSAMPFSRLPVTAACGLLRVDTPVWLIVALLLLSGCVRSIQYLGLNTVSYADVPPPLLSKSTSVGGVAQQLARGFGIAVGAALLAVIAGSAQVTIGHFALALYLIALVPLVSALGFLRLSPLDGAEVSGHRRAQPRSA